MKEGSDRFESTGAILTVGVAKGRYTFAPSSDPAVEREARAHLADEEAKTVAITKDGSAAVRTTYADGGQNAIFAALLKKGANLGTVSRPEALAFAGIDVTLIPGHMHKRPAPPLLALADWKPDHALLTPISAKTAAKVSPPPLVATLGIGETGAMPLDYALYRPPHLWTLIVDAAPDASPRASAF